MVWHTDILVQVQVHNSGKATEVDFPGISVLQACRTFSVHFREIADFSAKSTEQRQPGLPPGLLFLTFFLRYLHVQKKPRSSKSNSNESEVAGFGGVAVSNSEVQYYSTCTVILQYQVVRASMLVLVLVRLKFIDPTVDTMEDQSCLSTVFLGSKCCWWWRTTLHISSSSLHTNRHGIRDVAMCMIVLLLLWCFQILTTMQ